jgi:hypothetical protein
MKWKRLLSEWVGLRTVKFLTSEKEKLTGPPTVSGSETMPRKLDEPVAMVDLRKSRRSTFNKPISNAVPHQK